ncbi:MAG: glycosyltransferase [Nitrospirota bacterium]
MKILLVYSFKGNAIPLGIHCERALTNLGNKVIRHESAAVSLYDRLLFRPANKLLSNLRITREQPVGKNSKLNSINMRNICLINAVKETKPDLVFILRGTDFSPETLLKIKKEHNTKLICWWLEGPKVIEKSLEKAPCYDFYFINSQYSVEEHKKRGIKNCYYLPFGADLEYYTRTIPTAYQCDVGFIGAWDINRQNLLQNITGFDNVSIYGPKWRRKNNKDKNMLRIIKGEGIYNNDVAKFYSSTKINININAWYNYIPSGVSLRIFDIPACGGFLITDFVEELPELYKLPEEMETFKTQDEFIDKIKYYLKNDSIREKIAENGYKRVIADHTYEIRMKQVLDIISGN